MKEQPIKESKNISKERNPLENTLWFSDHEETSEMDVVHSWLDQIVDKNQTSLF